MDERRQRFRHLATSLNGDVLAFGEFKDSVHVFDLTTGNQISKFDTNLDFGGHRLAVSPNGLFCAIASYDDGSVTLTDIHGDRLWHREDVEEIQTVKFSLNGKSLFCSHHRGLISQFDVRTGEEIRFNWFEKHLHGAKIFVSTFVILVLFGGQQVIT